MKNLSKLALVLVFGLAQTAWSAETSVTVPSSAVPGQASGTISTKIEGQPEKGPSLLDSVDATLFSTYHGASLGDLGSNYTLDAKGQVNKTFTTNFDTTLSAHYYLVKDVGLGPYVPFLAVPAPGQHFVLGDVGGEFVHKKVVDTRELRVGANLIVQAPTSDYSKARHMDVSFKTTPYFWYSVPHSSFRLGAWTEAKAYLAVTSGKTFKLWAGPYVSYSFSDTLGVQLLYEMEAAHYYGKPSLDFASYQTDLQPGVVWHVTPHVFVNPYVQLFTGNKVSLENSALGAIISARML